jgi:blocked-early-in-transport protein 1
MSDAYERERQNNSRLAELSSKVSALRGVTVDIYDNARAQDVIDNTVGSPSFSLVRVVWKLRKRRLTKAQNSRIRSPLCPPP